ncbi:MAG: hypothetical protein LBM39_01770 [Candidatus Methanoplasma sp.]|nr:hypothetical protein [Candidatus Methanoplasma sp.]
MAKINLDATTVDSREQRLGTIVSWGGDALALSEESGYSKRKKGCGAGCRICESKGPFTQASTCSEQMVECQAGVIRGAILIQHAPIGCSVSQPFYNAYYRAGLKFRGHEMGNVQFYSTNMTEENMVFGGLDKLRNTIEDVWNHHHPDAIFISTSCPTSIIGDDVDSVAEEYTEKLGIPVIPQHCEGFRSKHWTTGFDVTQHGILRQIVDRDPVRKQEDLVNVINLFGSDVFGPMFAPLDLRVNYVVAIATVEELRQMSEAAATVTFCNSLGTYLAEGLEQAFGVPQVRAPQPCGTLGTDAWLRDLARVTHREHLVEDYIAREHERIAPELEELKKKLKGLRGFVSAGSAYAHGLITILRELGITVDGSIAFHHDPIYDSRDPTQDSLAHLVDNYGNVEDYMISMNQPFQFYTAVKKNKPDFILIKHNGLAPVAAKLGIPAATFGDEHFAIGYDGVIKLGNLVLEVIGRRRFCDVISKHTSSPYTKWWQDQTDPNILSKHPELIWEDD